MVPAHQWRAAGKDHPRLLGTSGRTEIRDLRGAQQRLTNGLVRLPADFGGFRIIAIVFALTVGGLSVLYAGVMGVSQLRLAGLATGGDPARDADLDAVFVGPGFHVRDYF